MFGVSFKAKFCNYSVKIWLEIEDATDATVCYTSCILSHYGRVDKNIGLEICML